ncbi:MAG: TldD/PmbA family protein [Gammaproteobacteria bacterium]
MAILSKNEARTILKKVMKLSKADGCQASLTGSVGGNIRYARNSVSTAGVVSDTDLAVQSNFGKRVGTATINEFDDDSLARVVRRSEELAQLSPENPEFMPVLGKQKYLKSKSYSKATADITPELRAAASEQSIAPSKAKKATAAGFLTDSADFQATMSSEGLFAYNTGTNANFTVTVRTDDGLGSGWATLDDNNIENLDTAAASRIAIDKAVMSREARALEPGKYTVILEPNALASFMGQMIFAFDARRSDEGRTFLSKKGGGNRIGEQVFDERVNLYADPSDANVPSRPWDDEGMPLGRLDIVKDGVVKNLFYSRYWANEKKVDARPQPNNLIMTGGERTQEEMVANTERGILVTRTWYIRAVDPQTQLYTGLTRDGTFYIEDGKIKYPIKNFRFNESPVIMLNNLEELGVPQRVSLFGFPVMLPPVKAREFTFTSLSDAV